MREQEVGDIWKSKESGTVFILTRKDDYFKDWFHSMASDGRTRKIIIDNRFFGLSEYLGKSKANIDDLFEVQDNKPDFSKMTAREILQYNIKKLENEE